MVAASCGLLLVGFLGNACSKNGDGFEESNQQPQFNSDAEAPLAPAPGCQEVKCSRDLKKVVSACDESVVVQQCDTGLGCAEGACIQDACRSAEIAKGSVGCSFYTMPPVELANRTDQCFAAIIANTWDVPVNVTAEYGGQSINIANSIYTAEKDGIATVHKPLEGPIPPGAVALVFLSQAPGTDPAGVCPPGVVPALAANPIIGRSGFTQAFRLNTDLPVSAYSIYPYGGAKTFIPSATLLLPTSAWSTNYLAVDGWSGTTQAAKPFLQVVAQEDNTEVRMRPIVNVEDGISFTGGAAGQTQVWNLSRGQVLQLTQFNSLAGSPIESTKPVGLFGGTQCSYVPGSASCCCDTLDQQIPPLSQWGSEYALVPYQSRLDTGLGGDRAIEEVPYRLVGAVNGTKLTYDPEAPTGAPETLAAGQVVSFSTKHLVTVKSQDKDHPFYAAVYMTSSTGPNVGKTLGDPDFVNIVPSDQFLDRYVFSTDHTYPETSLTLVRKKTNGAFAPVELDCAGKVTGWQALDTKGDYQYAFVKMTHGYLAQAFGTSTCGYGRHEVKSTGPFSVTVWGMGTDASYGYPGGMGLRPVNTVTVPVVVH
ncbi:hypothetical protein AKJ09_01733 [Labilithrix luteola]|uniref:IgGFc-binding protein N-terminal domain-containing protein n=1 Tax=Labilithrix luteola TaxID=1391654 RepID=A0A0K1PPL8_9BACT|nr:hypothetical protein AKJ09_01733 [Labilithrix luteola]